MHYRPGWDCHGLPIELRARGDGANVGKERTPLHIREEARNFALAAVDAQREEFKSWGNRLTNGICA